MDEEYTELENENDENQSQSLDAALYSDRNDEAPSSAQKEEVNAEQAEDSYDETEDSDEEKTISSDLIRGHINTIILRALYDGDKYGYEIIAEIERKSHKQYSLKQPSLYSALKRLEKEGFVTSYWGGSVAGGRRKYFSLTDQGKEMAERNQSEWEYSRTVIDNLISDREFDFESGKLPSAVDMRVLRQSTSRASYRGNDDEDSLPDDEDVDFTPRTFEDDEEEPAEPLNSPAFAQEQARLEEERARDEAERARREEEHSRREEELKRREEELRTREELFRAEEAQWNKTVAEETEKLRLEEERRREEEEAKMVAQRTAFELEARRKEEERMLQVQQERLAAEQAFREAEAERARLRKEIEEKAIAEERAYATSLNAEKVQQNARIVEMDPMTETRELYEQKLRDQEAAFKARHEQELAEQEMRIRKEDETKFRQREQQMIHQNYLNLVKNPVMEQPSVAPGYSASYMEQAKQQQPQAPVNPETERGYRSVIQKLYSSTISAPEPAPTQGSSAPTYVAPPTPTPVPPPPAPKREEPVAVKQTAPVKAAPEPAPEPTPAPTHAAKPKLLGRIDFYDLETRAAQDGIRISTAGGSQREVSEGVTVSLVHKGKALFFSALIVFLLCIAEGSIALALQNKLDLPRFFPYFIWGTGLALLLVTGLAFVNHYGERAIRQTGNLIVNTIISYALCLILIFIIALAAQADFSNPGEVASYVIFPIIYFFGIVVFGVSYYLQIRPIKND